MSDNQNFIVQLHSQIQLNFNYQYKMGAQNSNNRYSFTQQFYVIEDTFPADNYYRLQSKLTDQLFIGREISSMDKQDAHQLQCIINQKITNPSPFVTRLVSATRNNQKSYCETNSKFYLLFRQTSKLLIQQMEDRKYRQVPFTSEEILILIIRISKGLKYLYQIGHHHGNVSGQSITWPKFQGESIELIDDWALRNQNRLLKSIKYTQSQSFQQRSSLHSNDLYRLGVLAKQLMEVSPNNKRKQDQAYEELRQKIFILMTDNISDRMQIYNSFNGRDRQLEQGKQYFSTIPILPIDKLKNNFNPNGKANTQIIQNKQVSQPQANYSKNINGKTQANYQPNLNYVAPQSTQVRQTFNNPPLPLSNNTNRIPTNPVPLYQPTVTNLQSNTKLMYDKSYKQLSTNPEIPPHYQLKPKPHITFNNGASLVNNNFSKTLPTSTYKFNDESKINNYSTFNNYSSINNAVPQNQYTQISSSSPNYLLNGNLAIPSTSTYSYPISTLSQPISNLSIPAYHNISYPLTTSSSNNQSPTFVSVSSNNQPSSLFSFQNSSENSNIQYLNTNGKEKNKNTSDDNEIYTSADFLKKIQVDYPKKITETNLPLIKTDTNAFINTNTNTNTSYTNQNERKRSPEFEDYKQIKAEVQKYKVGAFQYDKDKEIQKKVQINYEDQLKKQIQMKLNSNTLNEKSEKQQRSTQQDQISSNLNNIFIKNAAQITDTPHINQNARQSQNLYNVTTSIDSMRPYEEYRQPKHQNNNQKSKEESNGNPYRNLNFQDNKYLQQRVSVIPELSEQSGGEDQDREYVVEEYENGSRFQGEKLDGMRDGKGKFYYRQGSYYDGSWKKNNMHGFGRLYYPNHKLAYEGDWFIDQFHGYGKVFNDEPSPIDGGFDYTNFQNLDQRWKYYEGTLVCDSKEGFGKLVLSNNEQYEGNFQGDRVHGQGRFHTKGGQIIHGIWEDSRLVKVF